MNKKNIINGGISLIVTILTSFLLYYVFYKGVLIFGSNSEIILIFLLFPQFILIFVGNLTGNNIFFIGSFIFGLIYWFVIIFFINKVRLVFKN